MFYDIAGLEIPSHHQGANLRPLVGDPETPWRDAVYYEAVTPEKSLGAKPHKLILTYNTSEAARAGKKVDFQELYDLENDPSEMNNLAKDPASKTIFDALKNELLENKRRIASSPLPTTD